MKGWVVFLIFMIIIIGMVIAIGIKVNMEKDHILEICNEDGVYDDAFFENGSWYCYIQDGDNRIGHQVRFE